jgi:hypothetical protein
VRADAASAAVLTLLAERKAPATICPSEAARRIADDKGQWRLAMPLVHAAVDRLLDQDIVRLSWKGKPLSARSGPYRIGLANDS